jgi:hypothetical protein
MSAIAARWAAGYRATAGDDEGGIRKALLRPFLGGGLGVAFAWAGGATATDLTVSAGAGLRVRLAELWSGRAELRVRSIDPFHGTVAEWTLGIARGL